LLISLSPSGIILSSPILLPKALGLTIPQSVLLRADEVIQWIYLSDKEARWISTSSHPLARERARVWLRGVSYYEVGRLSTKYVHRILTGTSPQNLPVESFSRVGLAVNARTARELGIAIPQSLLLRADEVIQ
jgi:hypothetical protein